MSSVRILTAPVRGSHRVYPGAYSLYRLVPCCVAINQAGVPRYFTSGTKASESTASAPGPWVERLDPATGLPFWYNLQSGESRDARPQEAKYQEQGERAPEHVQVITGLDGRQWERYTTAPPHDLPYWFHRASKESTWDDPAVTPPEKMEIDGPNAPTSWGRFMAWWKAGKTE